MLSDVNVDVTVVSTNETQANTVNANLDDNTQFETDVNDSLSNAGESITVGTLDKIKLYNVLSNIFCPLVVMKLRS